MKQIMKTLSIVMLAGLTLTGCKTAGEELMDGATPFTRGELYALLAEKTQVWSDGGAYFSQEGTIDTLRDGVRDHGEWSTAKDGSLCLHVESWGEAQCAVYYHNGDVVSTVTGEVTALAPKTYDNDALKYVEEGTEPPAEPFVKVLFTKEQTMELISGNTVIWGTGQGAYFAADMSVMTIWDGAKAPGTWSVEDSGKMCYDVPSWGQIYCEHYYWKGETLWGEFDGEDAKSDRWKDGDKVSSM